MNMNTGSPNFSRLLSMLALKRYEQPPPGYFHGFSGQVISRIRAGERAADPNVLQLLLIEWPWLQRLWIGLESKPARDAHAVRESDQRRLRAGEGAGRTASARDV